MRWNRADGTRHLVRRISTMSPKLRLGSNRNAAFTRQQYDLPRCCRLKAAFLRQSQMRSIGSPKAFRIGCGCVLP